MRAIATLRTATGTAGAIAAAVVAVAVAAGVEAAIRIGTAATTAAATLALGLAAALRASALAGFAGEPGACWRQLLPRTNAALLFVNLLLLALGRCHVTVHFAIGIGAATLLAAR